MKNRLFLIIATFAVLGCTITSCSWDGVLVVAPDGDQETPISFNVNLGSLPEPEVTTRGYSTDENRTGYTFEANDVVTLALTHSGSSEEIKQYEVTTAASPQGLDYKCDADGNTTYEFDWRSKSETLSLRAWSYGNSATPATVPSSFTVETNQNVTTTKELLYSPADDYSFTTNNGKISVPLYHQLSRIVVTVTCDDINYPATITIGHNSENNKVATTGTFSIPSSGDYYGEWTNLADYKVITPKTESTDIYSAVIIPATYAADMRLLNFVSDNKKYAYKLPAETTFEPGKQYNYDITVKNSIITVTSSITDWTDAVDGTDFSHGDGLSVMDIKRNPLWYVAKRNLNENGTSFSTEDNTSQGYLWMWNSTNGILQSSLGITYNTTGYNGWYAVGKNIEGTAYHLPTQMEWLSIVPANSSNNLFGSYPTAGTVVSENACTFGYNNDTKYGIGNNSNPATPTGTAFQSYWSSYTANSNVRYAIRFLGTDYCSVWKYQFVDIGTTSGRLIISSKLISPIGAGDNSALATMMTTITDAGYDWSGPGSVQRVFYACGYTNNSNGPAPGTYPNLSANVRGLYWSTTPNGSNTFGLDFYTNNLNLISGGLVVNAFSARLFRDN